MSHPAEIIDLAPTVDPATGRQIWMDLTATDGTIQAVGPQPSTPGTKYSRLPAERMAGSDPWEDIFTALGAGEQRGVPGPSDVAMLPGGQMVLATTAGQSPLSRLPQEKMAAVTAGPTLAEAELLRQIDPQRIEKWTMVGNELLGGWRFQLQPPYEARPYEFFAFRSPSDRNHYRVSVLWPKMDDEYGHKPHMIKVTVGGETIPVLCGPRGAAAKTIADARAHAGKWMLYTSSRVTGHNPQFSL